VAVRDQNWLAAADFARAGRALQAVFRPLRGFASRDARSEDGQAIVEAAITLPIIVFFVFTMIEVCLVFYSYCMISECAREGTRYAVVHGSACETASNASCTKTAAQVNTYVQTLGWPNLGMGALTANTTFPSGQTQGNPVTVTVTYVFPINMPFLKKRNLSMSSSSTMYIIQ
jgi:Flp pilus assembly protein TadG